MDPGPSVHPGHKSPRYQPRKVGCFTSQCIKCHYVSLLMRVKISIFSVSLINDEAAEQDHKENLQRLAKFSQLSAVDEEIADMT